LNRGDIPIQALIDLLLPTFRRYMLVEIALRIHESYAHERYPKVTRFLAIVAGKNAQAAGIDG
jgi:hypothetical protein